MSKELTAVSLFTGADVMDVGFERAGIKVVFANELMKEAAQTYNTNHPAGVMVNDDVNNVKDLFLSVYGTAPAEEKAGAVGLIKRGFRYGTE